jgi:hypothetical protein
MSKAWKARSVAMAVGSLSVRVELSRGRSEKAMVAAC